MRGAVQKRILAVLVIFAALDVVYRFTLYPRDLVRLSPEIVKLRESQPHTDLYYFGESSNVTFAADDSVKFSISEIIQQEFPGLKVTNVNQYATHAGIYREWLQQLEMPSAKPRAVVVTMNVRSFAAAWIHSELETPLRQSLVLGRPLPPLLNRFLLSLAAFDDKTEEERRHEMLKEWQTTHLSFPFPFKHRTVAEWDKAMANGGHLNDDGSWDIKKIELACHYIKAYAFNISDDNPRLADFDAIRDWSSKYKVPVYFNLMSENVHFADSLVGRELVFLMRQNRDFLVQRYNQGYCTVIDNLEKADSRSFIDKDWTTEHYDYSGRRAIAVHVADSLSKRFGDLRKSH